MGSGCSRRASAPFPKAIFAMSITSTNCASALTSSICAASAIGWLRKRSARWTICWISLQLRAVDIAAGRCPPNCSLLVWLLVTYALCAILRRVFQRASLYRLVWHRALFDLALFVCLLGSVAYLSSEFLP